jgi:hypothetical protein
MPILTTVVLFVAAAFLVAEYRKTAITGEW